MLNLGLVGNYIQNSQAPNLLKHLGQKYNIGLDYKLFDLSNEKKIDLNSFLKNLIIKNYHGLNITFPFKEKVLEIADILEDEVKLVGSSNLLLFKEKIIARNTDYLGFKKLLDLKFKNIFQNVLVIGGGGIGRSVCFALGKFGVKKIYLLEKDSQKADKLILELKNNNISAKKINDQKLNSINIEAALNCSPVGHEHSPGNPAPYLEFHKLKWIFDAVYIPAETQFIAQAKKNNLMIISGIELFVFQGVEAFLTFSNKESLKKDVYSKIDNLLNLYLKKLS